MQIFTSLHQDLYHLAAPFMSHPLCHYLSQVFHSTTGNLLYQLGDETMPRYPVVSVRFKEDKDDSSVKNILLATCE